MLLRLKKTDVDEWIRIGKPDVILNNSIKNNLLVLAYIFSNKHKASGDWRLTAYVWTVRVIGTAALLSGLWLVSTGNNRI